MSERSTSVVEQSIVVNIWNCVIISVSDVSNLNGLRFTWFYVS